MIDVRNIGFSYSGDARSFSLKSVSFTCRPGERVVLMGANGSGKTTLIHALLGLLPLSEGSIEVDGFSLDDVRHHFEIRRRIGLMFQNPDNQMVATTVEREIAFGLENLAVPSDEIRRKVDQALVLFQLESYRSMEPHRLSGGERQRLALASIWVMAPHYLILDEPTSLLDPRNRREVLRLLDEEMGGRSMGIILVTQLPEEALMADRLLVMHEGRLVADDAPLNLFQNRRQFLDWGLDIPTSLLVEQMLERRA